MTEMKDLLPEEIKYPQEIKCPVVLLIDTSGSMYGEPIRLLNDGVELLLKELRSDDKAKRRVELSIIAFGGGIKVVHPLATVDDIQFSPCSAGGDTPMGKAVMLGLELLEETKKRYREEGIPYYRPWLVLITDGYPTDMRPQPGDPLWQEAASRIQDAEDRRKALCWAFGVEGAEMDTLGRLFQKGRVYRLEGFPFKELFMWLSNSIGLVMNSNPGDKLELDKPPGSPLTVEV